MHKHTQPNGGCHFDTPGSCSQVDCTAFRVPGSRQELLSCFVVASCHGYCTSQCSDLAQLAPTSKGLSISPYVQRLTLHWITLSTLLMMAHKAETAVQGWSVDPMEAVILTHRVLAARSTVRLSESLAVGKSFSLVLWSLVVMVTAQASVVILLSLHPQARG